jgi:hypothetical protein
MNWRHETWRKLYVREEGTFAQLPLFTRGLAAELLKICDDSGVIALGGKPLVNVIAFRLGATTGDRRLLPSAVAALFQDGYLIPGPDCVRMKNFVPAQGKKPIAFEEVGATSVGGELALNSPSVGSQLAANSQSTRSENEGNSGQSLQTPSVVPSVPIRSEPAEGEPPPPRPQADREIWAAYEWERRFKDAWANDPKYDGQFYRGNDADSRATGDLHEELLRMDRPARLAAQRRAPEMFAEYLGRSRATLVEARHRWRFFVEDFGGLLVPKAKVATPKTETFAERDERLRQEARLRDRQDTARQVAATNASIARLKERAPQIAGTVAALANALSVPPDPDPDAEANEARNRATGGRR